METRVPTIDFISGIFCQATKKTLEKSTKKLIKYSDTIQSIPKISLKPELGCFVQFSGDYNGLIVMNLSAKAAMDIYRNYMITMGLPEDDLAKNFTSSEVVDTMGEITNQVMGRAMRMIESKYDLCASFGQPKSLALNNAITLTPEQRYSDNRRMVFAIGTDRFTIELSMEKTEFISLNEVTRG
ncbi:MAG: chemotaxis protein CheX [Thermodesulfobacteriota bacterium]|nr:chemotaxis protein CheX [Thermodesulfobacteriota bacterium]